jgi:hypothetical protein
MKLLKVRSINQSEQGVTLKETIEAGLIEHDRTPEVVHGTTPKVSDVAPHGKGRRMSRTAFTAFASAYFAAGVTYHGGPVDTTVIGRLPISYQGKEDVLKGFEKLKATPPGDEKENLLYELLTGLTKLAGY